MLFNNNKPKDRLNASVAYQKLVNEYFFAMAIDKVNKDRVANYDKPLSVREARALHKKWIETTAKQPAMASYLKSVSNAIDKGAKCNYENDDACLGFMGDAFIAMRKTMQPDAVQQCKNRTAEMVQSLNEVLPEANLSIGDYTAITKTFGQHTVSSRYENTQTNYIPLSPYDEAFATRSAFLSAPSSILFVDAASLPGSYDTIYDVPTGVTNNIQMFTSNKFDAGDLPKRYNMFGGKDNPVLFYGSEDVCGFSAFKSYMTKDEYNKLRGIYMKAHAESRPTAEQLRRSARLLQSLSEEGYEYSMTCRANGELIARFDDSPISMTIVPAANTDFNFNFGKVVSNRVHYRFSTNARKSKGPNQYESEAYMTTAEDAMNLLHFAEGKPIVKRSNRGPLNEYVGQVGVMVTPNRAKIKKPGENFYVRNTAYYTSNNRAVFQYDVANGNELNMGNITVTPMVTDRTRHFGTTGMTPQEDAVSYIQSSIASARSNFLSELAVEDMIAQADAHRMDSDYVYPYSTDDTVASIQKKYWEFLTADVVDGQPPKLAVPGTEKTHFGDDEDDSDLVTLYYHDDPEYQLDASGNPVLDAEGNPIVLKSAMQKQLEHHAMDSVNSIIGTYEPDEMNKRFNPVGVTTYMVSDQTIDYNNDSMIVAMDLAGIDADELRGSDFYAGVVKNRLLKFDPESAQKMSSHDSLFIRKMQAEIKSTLETSGCEVDDDDILIDNNGVVQYKVKYAQGMVNGMAASSDNYTVNRAEKVGYIGQIFAPEKDSPGVVTKFANGDNYMFVPGYTATILLQKEGENLSFEERTRLDGYEQHMARAIRSHIKEDLLVPFSRYDNAPTGETTGLNHVYRQLYDVRHPVNFIELSTEEGMTEDLRRAILETEASRVSYGKRFKEGATLNAYYQVLSNPYYLQDDLSSDPLVLTGGRNMAIMSREGDGIYDRDATSTGITQGITRYLAKGVKVDLDGKIIPTEDKNARTPLFDHEYMRFSDNVPFDRRQMVVNNLLKAQAVTEPTKMAQMTLGGWNFDDGFVVTDRFANKYQVRDHEGNMRPMKVGDKILDFGGNKGVIPLIFDTNMTAEEAKEQGLEEVYDFFHANPDVDVVGAPYAAVGRFNASTYLECSEDTLDMKNPKTGETIPGAIGTARFIVTHMTVDEKTHVYDDEAFEQGGGRSASAQLAWALDSKGSKAIKKLFYGDNDRAYQNMREYFILCGLDMDPTGKILEHYTAQPGENRNIFDMPVPQYRPPRKEGGSPILNVRASRNNFIQEIGKKGGFLKLPFPLHFPEGRGEIPRIVDKETGEVAYGLPVLSSYLRSGQRFEDGTQSVHDYTKQYATIYEYAVRYIDAENKLQADNLSDKERADIEKTRTEAISRAQRAYSEITDDVITHKFDSKYNAFKSDLMSNKLPHSATAVWTADPRLNIDEIAIGPDMMESLSVKDGEKVMIWRDPILRDGGMRYMKVKVQEGLTGVAINPTMDKSFDGDFDGDSIGVEAIDVSLADNPTSKELREAAIAEFNEKWTQYAYGNTSLSDEEIIQAKQHIVDSHNASVRRQALADFSAEWRELSANPALSEAEYDAGRALMESEMTKPEVLEALNKNRENAWNKAQRAGVTEEDFAKDWDDKQLYHYSKAAARKEFISEYRKNNADGKYLDANAMDDANIKFEMQWLRDHGSKLMQDIYTKGYNSAMLSDPSMTIAKYNAQFVHTDSSKLLHDEMVARKSQMLNQLSADGGYKDMRLMTLDDYEAARQAEYDQGSIAALANGVFADFVKDFKRKDASLLRKHARLAYAEFRLQDYVTNENNGQTLSTSENRRKLSEFSNEWIYAHTSQLMLDEERKFREANAEMSDEWIRDAWSTVNRSELIKQRHNEAFVEAMYEHDRGQSELFVHDKLRDKALRDGKTLDEFETSWAGMRDSADIQGQINDAYDNRYKRNAKMDNKIMEHREIRDEADRLFSVQANLLDYGVQNEDGTFDIMMNHGLDLKTAEFNRPELKERFDKITADVNTFEKLYNNGDLSYDEVSKLREAAVQDLNDYVHEAFEHDTCEAVVSYASDYDHMYSLSQIVNSGAKGKPSKLVDYGRYAGIKIDMVDGPDGKKVLDLEHMKVNDNHEPIANRDDSLGVEYATAVKASVGISGKYSQRGIKACRDICAKAILEMTYPSTQGLLQAKHDPIEAVQKYALLRTSLRDCWQGYELQKKTVEKLSQDGKPVPGEYSVVWEKIPDQDETGKAKYDDDHRLMYKKATPEVWEEQLIEMCTSSDGLNVPINKDYVHEIATALTNEDGVIRGIEDKDAGCLLDRLAYKEAKESAIDILVDAAKKGERLYDGERASYFMPRGVEHNLKAMEAGKMENVKVQSKSDTRAKGEASVQIMSTNEYGAYMSDVTEIPEIEDEASVLDYLESNDDFAHISPMDNSFSTLSMPKMSEPAMVRGTYNPAGSTVKSAKDVANVTRKYNPVDNSKPNNDGHPPKTVPSGSAEDDKDKGLGEN